jgi:hypothetical protein
MRGPMKRERDVEKTYPIGEFVEKLRRLADALERGEDGEEIEFQIK